MVNYLKRSRLFRGIGMGMFMSAFIQNIIALTTEYWQMGSCSSGACFWRMGLPWTTHNYEGIWLVVLALGILAAIILLCSLIASLIEMCVGRCKLDDRWTFIIITFGIVALLFLLLHWVLYLIFSMPLKGSLSFSFNMIIMATICDILAIIFYFVGVHYARKWRNKSY